MLIPFQDYKAPRVLYERSRRWMPSSVVTINDWKFPAGFSGLSVFSFKPCVSLTFNYLQTLKRSRVFSAQHFAVIRLSLNAHMQAVARFQVQTPNSSLTDSSQAASYAVGTLPGLKTWHHPPSHKFCLLSSLPHRSSVTDGARLLFEQAVCVWNDTWALWLALPGDGKKCRLFLVLSLHRLPVFCKTHGHQSQLEWEL